MFIAEAHTSQHSFNSVPARISRRRYAAGAQIYREGEKAEELFMVHQGTVRLYRLLADGRRQIPAFCTAGDVFGYEIDNEHRFFADAVTASEIQVVLPEDGCTFDLLQSTISSLVVAQEHLLVLGRRTALERVCSFLLSMLNKQHGRTIITLPMCRIDIADHLGLTIETTSRIFKQLDRDRLIRVGPPRVVELLDTKALRAVCNGYWDS